MEWPPMTLHFASAIFERPPRIICSRISGSPLSGKPTIDSAEIGLPPMAYTSLSEFAAAICPNVNGSSTIGVKKSTVCTSAISGLSRYTPASSLVSKPTSTFGSVGRGKRRKTESSNPGLSFAAQPAALTMTVSFTVGVKPHLAVMPLDYSDVPSFVLALSGLGALGTLVTCVTRWKVFSFADALGHLADFLGARRDSAVAWTDAHEEIAGRAPRQHYGAACPLCLDDCLSMGRRRSSGMAGKGTRIHGLPAGFDNPGPKPNSCRRGHWCAGNRGPSMAEPAARRETSRRSAGLLAGPWGTDSAAIYRGVAALFSARDYGRPLRGVSLSRVRHSRPSA